MKILKVFHNHLNYEFRLFEQSGLIQIIKETNLSSKPNYEIMKDTKGKYVCDCPGAKYHKKCWHLDIIEDFASQPSCTEPWCEWAEEAMRERLCIGKQ